MGQRIAAIHMQFVASEDIANARKLAKARKTFPSIEALLASSAADTAAVERSTGVNTEKPTDTLVVPQDNNQEALKLLQQEMNKQQAAGQ